MMNTISFRLYDLAIPCIIALSAIFILFSYRKIRMKRKVPEDIYDIPEVPVRFIELVIIFKYVAAIYVIIDFCFILCALASSLLAAVIAANELNSASNIMNSNMMSKIILYSIGAILFSTIGNIIHARDAARGYRAAFEELNKALLMFKHPDPDPDSPADPRKALHQLANIIVDCERLISNDTYRGKWT